MFCPDEHLKASSVANLLKGILTLDDSQIVSFYDEWRLGKSNMFPIDRSHLTKCFHEYAIAAHLLGIDLPVWFGGPAGKRVMLICQDPLRWESDFAGHSSDGTMLVGSPFSVHTDTTLDKPPKYAGPYWTFLRLLSQSHFVYVTDTWKLYFHRNGKASNVLPDFIALPDHIRILQEEIKLVGPDMIILLGKNAVGGLGVPMGRRISEKVDLSNLPKFGSTPVLALPHLSGAGRKHVKRFLMENGFPSQSPPDEYAELVEKAVSGG